MTNSTIPSTEPFSTIRLPDGRVLAYLEVGKADGPAIFHFHGHGSSRLEVLLLAEQASDLGVRVIALDRQGIGRSDPQLGDSLMDWPDDVAQAADHLGIEQFAVEGVSAGGPYALACAHKIPHRLTGCGLISTQAPLDLVMKAGPGWMRILWWIGIHFPEAFRAYLRLARSDALRTLAAEDKRLRQMAIWVAKADRDLLRTPELRGYLARAMVESNRQGGAANRDEVKRQIHPWGFSLARLAFERMFLWHGEKDRVAPVAPARLLAQTLPHCHAMFYRGEGHFSVLVNHARDIFSALRV